jgi:UDP-2,3-diacylglucosamine hydrolase
MRTATADAVVILGDLFEVWVGDDAVRAGSFEAECVAVLRDVGQRLSLYIMQGNRDFLMGEALMGACHATLLPDPSVLTFGGQRWTLSHGDALCLDDTEYQAFRRRVRSPVWQADFLNKPLSERQAIAREMREASQSRQQGQALYADVDPPQALRCLATAHSRHLIHGHTHRPAEHALDALNRRTVLSDWDMQAAPPRAEILRLSLAGQTPHLNRIGAQAIANVRG